MDSDCFNGAVSLKKQGYTKVFTLEGGITQWSMDNLPLSNKINLIIRKYKMSDNANAQNQNTDQPAFDIVRIYAKDCSLETPNVPGVFTKEWKPEIKIDFDAKLRTSQKTTTK